MADKNWKEIEVGFVVDKPGRAKEYCTGDWRSQKPVYDRHRCIKCGVCYMFCPEAAIKFNDDRSVYVDEYYCKGCGICSRECVTGCFTMKPLDSDDEQSK